MKITLYTTLLLIIIIVQLPSKQCQAQNYSEAQNKIKSIYLFNFITKIEWANASIEEFRVCLLEKDQFYFDFERIIYGRKRGSRNISVNAIKDISDCAKCDLIFLDEKSSSAKPKRNSFCSSLFVTSGFYESTFSDIALLYNDSKLQFSINKELCHKNGFKIPAQLVALANQNLIQQ